MRAQFIDQPQLIPENIKNIFCSNGTQYSAANLSDVLFPAVCVGDFLFFKNDLPKPEADLRQLLGETKSADAEKMILALQLLNWDHATRFCCRCGGNLIRIESKTAKKCSSCEKEFYPSPQPVVIVLIRKENQILLAKGLAPKKFYSCIAGFVEPGESIEDSVRREVREEVGLEVQNIQYFRSQMWPFPNNLMLGFTADWLRGEIQIDPSEITDAQWIQKIGKFNPQLRSISADMLPTPASIAREMINAHFLRKN